MAVQDVVLAGFGSTGTAQLIVLIGFGGEAGAEVAQPLPDGHYAPDEHRRLIEAEREFRRRLKGNIREELEAAFFGRPENPVAPKVAAEARQIVRRFVPKALSGPRVDFAAIEQNVRAVEALLALSRRIVELEAKRTRLAEIENEAEEFLLMVRH